MYYQFRSLILLICGLGLIGACEEEQRVRSASEFVENPMMLEAAMVRCSMDRDKTRYDAECINARQAVAQIEAKEEEARKADFDTRSENKRQALRRTQEAAAKARNRAAAAEDLRKEAEYLAQFGAAPAADMPLPETEAAAGNSPLAVLPDVEEADISPTVSGDVSVAVDGGNAPVVGDQTPPQQSAPGLDSIRDELQRRDEAKGD
jgi:hypothetical protein